MSDDLDNTPLKFGKYKGQTPVEIGKFNPGYVCWMYRNVKPKPCSAKLWAKCSVRYMNHLEASAVRHYFPSSPNEEW